MLKTLIVTNKFGESLEIELARPEKSGLAVLSIDGLGPVDSPASVTQYANRDGGYYVTSRMPSRNITINMAMLDPIEENRRKCYHFFNVKDPITLKFIFESGKRNAIIGGYVESNSPNIFSNFEQADISIICPDPFFRDLDENGETGSTIEPFYGSVDRFEFEFECAEIVSGENGVEFGDCWNDSEKNILCNSEYDIGVTMIMRVVYAGPDSTRTPDNIVIKNNTNNSRIVIDKDAYSSIVGHVPSAGDIIVVVTGKGQKTATVQNQIVQLEYNILDSVIGSGTWLYLTPGKNDIEIDYGDDNTIITEVSVAYENLYAGL